MDLSELYKQFCSENPESAEDSWQAASAPTLPAVLWRAAAVDPEVDSKLLLAAGAAVLLMGYEAQRVQVVNRPLAQPQTPEAVMTESEEGREEHVNLGEKLRQMAEKAAAKLREIAERKGVRVETYPQVPEESGESKFSAVGLGAAAWLTQQAHGVAQQIQSLESVSHPGVVAMGIWDKIFGPNDGREIEPDTAPAVDRARELAEKAAQELEEVAEKKGATIKINRPPKK